jgi:RimJ/RimL family protein N-acetyltransferase
MVVIPEIETPRLILRARRLEDFDAFAAIWASEGVVRFVGGVTLSREAAWVRFLRQEGHWHLLGFGYFAVEDRATGRFIGEVGFQDMRRGIVPSIEGLMEAGWILAEEAQGRGLAEEAMRAALGWADVHGTGERIACIIHPDHAGSLRVAEKLGFVATGEGIYNGGPMVMLERPRPGP